jgi:sulfite exporter TauE/SafE
MGIYRYLTEGLILGLTLAPACAAVCWPVLLPYLASEQRPFKIQAATLAWFMAGRLAGYALVGAAAGWFGLAAGLPALAGSRWEGAALILLGGIMAGYGLTSAFPEYAWCRSASPIFGKGWAPAALGVLTGLNLCPPFITAVFSAARAGNAANGTLVFLGFFLGTSVLLVPALVVGQVARSEALRLASRIAAAIIGAWFFIQGLLLVA